MVDVDLIDLKVIGSINMAHFSGLDLDGVMSLQAYSEKASTTGRVPLWLPFIEMNSTRRLLEVICRLLSDDYGKEDQELFYVFFHEYIHIVQSALFPVCQYPLTLTHQYIFDIYVTAQHRQASGSQELLPLIHGEGFVEELDLVRRVYGKPTSGQSLNEGMIGELSTVHIIEGTARILEEKYRGASHPPDKLYCLIQDINAELLGENALALRELLDVSEVALLTLTPREAFVGLLERAPSIVGGCGKDSGFFDRLCDLACDMGFKIYPRSPRVVINSTQSVLRGPLFDDYNRYVESLYQGLAAEYGKGPVFSSIYDALEGDKGKGMPLILVSWIAKYGTPAIVYPDGYMEQFDRRKDIASRERQDLVGVKAVVESVANPKFFGCGLFHSCNGAYVEDPIHHHAPSWTCVMAPWLTKTFANGYCPYQAIWRQFGLGDLVRGHQQDDNVGMNSVAASSVLEFRLNTSFNCIIRVWPNDKGGIPHFHVYTEDVSNLDKKTGIDCAIRINEARYFKHNSHLDELNSSQRKELNRLLRKERMYKGKSIIPWEEICREWNAHDAVVKKADMTMPIPDYTQIEEG